MPEVDEPTRGLPATWATIRLVHASALHQPRDRSLTLIYAQLFDEAAMADTREILDEEVDEVTAEFEVLPVDADESNRARLAEQVAGPLARAQAD